MCDTKSPARDSGESQNRVGRPIELRRIPAGTRVQIGGLPFLTVEPVVVEGHPDNFARAAVDVVFPQPSIEGTDDPRPLGLVGGHIRSRY